MLKIKYKEKALYIFVIEKLSLNVSKITFTRFLCWTLDNIATSLANLASLLAISSGVSPLWTTLIATFWFLYLLKGGQKETYKLLVEITEQSNPKIIRFAQSIIRTEPQNSIKWFDK